MGVTLHLDAEAIEPGERITGTVGWSGKIGELTVLLRWETSGKGTTDTAIVARKLVTIPDREAAEARFELKAPEQPFTFSGKLISLTYYVRVEDLVSGFIETEIVIAPGGREVRLAGA